MRAHAIRAPPRHAMPPCFAREADARDICGRALARATRRARSARSAREHARAPCRYTLNAREGGDVYGARGYAATRAVAASAPRAYALFVFAMPMRAAALLLRARRGAPLLPLSVLFFLRQMPRAPFTRAQRRQMDEDAMPRRRVRHAAPCARAPRCSDTRHARR